MMEGSIRLFGIYLFLAVYCAGSMSVLQLQHFALYPKVGPATFKDYVTANNSAAVLPAMLPAVLLTVVTVALLFFRPAFMARETVLFCLILNGINMVSSFIWQAKIHGQLAQVGYDEVLIQRLIKTNWIRTTVLFIQGLIAVYCATSALR